MAACAANQAKTATRLHAPPFGLRALTLYFLFLAMVVVRVTTSSGFARAALDATLLIGLCLAPWSVRDPLGGLRTLRLLSLFNGVYFGLSAYLILMMEAAPTTYHPEQLHLLYRNMGGGEPLVVLDRGIRYAIAAQVALIASFLIPRYGGHERSAIRQRVRRWPSEVVDLLNRPALATSVTLAFVVGHVEPAMAPLAIRNALQVWGALIDVLIVHGLVRWRRDRRLPGEDGRHARLSAAVSGQLRWLPLLLLKLVVAVYSGWKGSVLEVGLLLVIAIVLDTGRLPIRWLAIGVVLTGLWLPWAIPYRDNLWGRSTSGVASRVEAASQAWSSASHLSIRDRVVTSVRFVAHRVGSMRLDELAGAATGRLRLHGDSLWPFLSSPVPRFVWPSKPSLSPEFNVIARELGKGQPDDLQTSMVWTQYTDLVLNFGAGGLFVGSALLGLAVRRLNTIFLESPEPTAESLALFYVLFRPFWLENTIGFLMLNVVHLAVVLFVLLHIGRVHRRRRLPSLRGVEPCA